MYFSQQQQLKLKWSYLTQLIWQSRMEKIHFGSRSSLYVLKCSLATINEFYQTFCAGFLVGIIQHSMWTKLRQIILNRVI
jgi:hypothetical protein